MKGEISATVREKIGHYRLFKDKIYTQKDWDRQKSWRRFQPQPLVTLRVLGGFSWPVISMTIVAIFITLYHGWLETIGAPKFWDHQVQLWQPFSLSSFCLALLLVHRTTAAYNRWWEARTVWGSVLNVSRNIMRTCGCSWGFPPKERALLEMLARWVMAMPYLLKAHMRKNSARPELENLLPADELDYLLEADEACQRCAQVVSSIVGNAMPGPEYKQTRLWVDEQITLYVNHVGACERIYKTPIPIAFTRHLTRFLLVWLTFIPFALWPVVGWATPVVQFFLAFLLIGTENIGIQVEEPFCIMTLDAFCTGIEKTVREIVESNEGANEMVNKVQRAGQCLGFHRRDLGKGEDGDDSSDTESPPSPLAKQQDEVLGNGTFSHPAPQGSAPSLSLSKDSRKVQGRVRLSFSEEGYEDYIPDIEMQRRLSGRL